MWVAVQYSGPQGVMRLSPRYGDVYWSLVRRVRVALFMPRYIRSQPYRQVPSTLIAYSILGSVSANL
jgi:hypothetical protein